jgi:Trypsin-like peptidase domain
METGMILRVGDGRGFVVDGDYYRNVITAAHCLPGLVDGKCPRAHLGRYTEEATYRDILGRLDETPNIWAACLFVDPIGDIAVLGAPDGEIFPEQYWAYQELTGGDGAAFKVADIPGPQEDLVEAAWREKRWEDLNRLKHPAAAGYLYSLQNEWISCRLTWCSRIIKIDGVNLEGGMSGSPVIDADGHPSAVWRYPESATTPRRVSAAATTRASIRA